MTNRKYTKTQQAIAQDILTELEQQWKVVKNNDAGQLFFSLRDYIKQTYLLEDNEQ